jgi:hypothetical protein
LSISKKIDSPGSRGNPDVEDVERELLPTKIVEIFVRGAFMCIPLFNGVDVETIILAVVVKSL